MLFLIPSISFPQQEGSPQRPRCLRWLMYYSRRQCSHQPGSPGRGHEAGSAKKSRSTPGKSFSCALHPFCDNGAQRRRSQSGEPPRSCGGLRWVAAACWHSDPNLTWFSVFVVQTGDAVGLKSLTCCKGCLGGSQPEGGCSDLRISRPWPPTTRRSNGWRSVWASLLQWEWPRQRSRTPRLTPLGFRAALVALVLRPAAGFAIHGGWERHPMATSPCG